MTGYNQRAEALQNGTLDQFYTQQALVRSVISKVSPYIDTKTIRHYVDHSAGDGYVSFYLQTKFKLQSVHNYDIAPSSKQYTKVTSKDWLRVNKLDNASSTLVGFNPPFGTRGKMAMTFITHAAKLGAGMIISILPKHTSGALPHYRLVTKMDVNSSMFSPPVVLPCVLILLERHHDSQFDMGKHVAMNKRYPKPAGVARICFAKVGDETMRTKGTRIVIRRIGNIRWGCFGYAMWNGKWIKIRKTKLQAAEDLPNHDTFRAVNSFILVDFEKQLSELQLTQIVHRLDAFCRKGQRLSQNALRKVLSK